MGMTVLREKTLILHEFLQKHYWKLLEIHTVSSSSLSVMAVTVSNAPSSLA